jgi:hypothetical protein
MTYMERHMDNSRFRKATVCSTGVKLYEAIEMLSTVLQEAAIPADNPGRNDVCVLGIKFDLVHHVPGRLRLRSFAFKNNAAAFEPIRRQLAEIQGLISCAWNPCTGSIVLKYDRASILPTEIIKVISAYGLTVIDRTEPAKRGASRRLHDIVSAITRLLLKALAERLALSIAAAFI